MATVPDTDYQIIQKVKEGDKRAFDLLVIKYQHRVLAVLYNYIHDAHEAQDLAQETFVRAYRSLENFRGDSAFYTWLYRIAINVAKNHLIAKNRKTPVTDINIEDVNNSGLLNLQCEKTPEYAAENHELEMLLFSAVDRLPENLRVAVMMRELEGLSYDEIAHFLQCPTGTVRSRIYRARILLENMLQITLGKKGSSGRKK